MTDQLTVQILRAADNATVDALVAPVTPDHLAKARSWRQFLVQAQEPDKAWDWEDFQREALEAGSAGTGQFEALAMVVEGEVQALMLLETQARVSRKDGGGLVYVEYLAVAPHNRPSATPRRYRRCGEAMLAVALHRSRSVGHEGRIGLHSLPTSVPFYVRMGLHDLGADPDEGGLRYFELGPDVVQSE